ncbi:hypothetical protein NDU88_000895 [Pleurodeles waltl]|uniref:Uncharacterized protein n=1 Tax=Pleurodeles waltl TaxID=8319 RepID=A0AAV7P276_PLEWA|nr:hypothetical protein NDU88_000895 [Pleurodeles waltl]
MPPVRLITLMGQMDEDSEDYKFNEKIGERMKVGDLVKVKSRYIEGGLTKFRGPFKVRSVQGWVVTLENGERWNMWRVALYERGSSDVAKALGSSNKEVLKSCGGFMMKDCDVLGKNVLMLL